MDNYKKKAYTLLELIIAVSIILLFSGISIAQYNTFTNKQKLETETQKLASLLELARKKTLNRNTDPSCVDNFSGYQISFSLNQYVFSYCCAGICSSPLIQTVSFPTTNIQIISPPSPIIFTPSFQGTNLSSNIDIKVKNSSIGATNNCMKITVTTNGITTVDNTLIPCP